MFNQLICPVSNEKLDSNISQLTIFLSVILVVLFLTLRQPVFLYLATLDYGIRAFTSGRYSPLRYIATMISRLFQLNPRMIDKAPKVFASRLGFICLIMSSILINVDWTVFSISIALLATSLFLLDALGIVCVGCIIYHHLVFPYFSKNKL